MSQISIRYYLEETIEKELKCESCQKKYNTPKLQPCGCSICIDCEKVIFSNHEVRTEIECSICHETYELPQKSFIINKSLHKLLNILPISVYRGGLHAETMRKLHDGKVLDENFTKELNDSQSVIIEFCDIQTNLVDIKTESLQVSLNNHRDTLLAEISEFKTKCLEEVKRMNNYKFLEFINENKKKYENLNLFLNGSDINDDDVQEKLKEILELKKSFENNRNIFDSLIYKKRKLEFVESDFNLEDNNIIGKFNYNSLFGNFLKGINEYQSIKNINYENENHKKFKSSLSVDTPSSLTSSIKEIIQTKVLEIKGDKFCIIIKFEQDNKLYFQIQTFSIDDILLNEITNELISKKTDEFNALIFQQNILIVETFDQNNFSIKVYDSELNECEQKQFRLFKRISETDSYYYQLNKRNTVNYRTVNYNLKYLILVSKSSFYILKCTIDNKYPELAAINKNLEKETEEDVPNGVFNVINLKNTFIESDKIFTFESDSLNIYDLVGNFGDKYATLKTIKFNFTVPTKCLYHLIDEENFAIVNQESKKFSYLNINTNKIKIEAQFHIEKVNKISSFFLTKSNYLAIHDDEEKIIHVFTDESFCHPMKLQSRIKDPEETN